MPRIDEKDYDGSHCPNCNSSNLNGDGIELQDNSAYRNCDCEDCGAYWTEDFKIVGYSELMIPDKEQ